MSNLKMCHPCSIVGITAADGAEAFMAGQTSHLLVAVTAARSLLSKTSPYKYATKKLIDSTVIFLRNLMTTFSLSC